LYRLPAEALDRRCVDSFVDHPIAYTVYRSTNCCLISTRQVSRLNYGIILFSPVRRVQLVSDVWSHIFDLHLPDMTPGNLHITLPHCDNATSNAAQERAQRICVNNTTLFLELHKQHVEMVNEILETLQHVYHPLPAEKNIYRPTMAKSFCCMAFYLHN